MSKVKQEKYCKDCNILLTDENQYPSGIKHGSRICKKCLSKRVLEHRHNRTPLTVGVCRYCNASMTPENWSLTNRKAGYKCCIMCNRKQANQKYLRRKAKLRETMITTKVNGKPTVIYTNKRPYSNTCELCGTQTKTAYHHWNSEQPHWGLWLCWQCHMLAEGIDEKGLVLAQKYLNLKPQIESNWHKMG